MDLTTRLAEGYSVREWMAGWKQYLLRPASILRSYRSQYLGPDLLAGLTVAVVLLPQAIAYALVAELPPETGIYAAIMASIFGALWGSSAHLQTGPTNAASILVLSTLVVVAPPGSPAYIAAAALMALMVGVARLLMGLGRLGVLVNFVSDSVVIGFTAGAGILISANQLSHLLGLKIDSSVSFFTTLQATFTALPQTHLPSLLVGLATVTVMVVVRRLRPGWPNALIGMSLAGLLVAVLGLHEQGVAVLGELPRGFPPLAVPPLFDLHLIGQISTGALAVAAIGLVEAMSIARTIAAQNGQYLDSNQEFVGQGIANLAAGFFSGYTCSGSFTRSAVNYKAGGRTALSSVFTGLWVLLALLLFAPLAAYLPRTALAGVLIVTAYGMVDRKEMGRIWHSSPGDSLIMVATLLATVLLPLEFAVLAGMIISFGRYIIRTARPAIYPVVPNASFQHFVRQVEQPGCPQLGVITMVGSLFFGAAHALEDAVRANLKTHPEQNYLLLRMHVVDHLDISGVHVLETIVRLYRQRGGDVFISGARSEVRAQIHDLSFDRFLGEDHFLDRETAISHLFHQVLQPSVCIYECPVRVFAECQALPKAAYPLELQELCEHPEHHLQKLLPSELKGWLELSTGPAPLLLVDVREAAEHRQGHIPGARLLPLRLILREAPTLPQQAAVVLICRSGRRSRMASYILQDLGHHDVYNLQGGMLAWEAAGYPIAIE